MLYATKVVLTFDQANRACSCLSGFDVAFCIFEIFYSNNGLLLKWPQIMATEPAPFMENQMKHLVLNNILGTMFTAEWNASIWGGILVHMHFLGDHSVVVMVMVEQARQLDMMLNTLAVTCWTNFCLTLQFTSVLLVSADIAVNHTG